MKEHSIEDIKSELIPFIKGGREMVELVKTALDLAYKRGEIDMLRSVNERTKEVFGK